MDMELLPSMMCADLGSLAREVEALEDAGADGLHIDIMDGRFVPNHALSLTDLQYLAKKARVPLNVHFMIERPAEYIAPFLEPLRAGDTVYIHAEADARPAAVLSRLKERGLVPGVALDPGTAAAQARELLKLAETVLVMTVHPGRAGQKYLPWVDEKIEELLRVRERYGFELCLDGAVGEDTIARFAPAGVKGFVLGTRLLFGKPEPYAQILARTRGTRA